MDRKAASGSPSKKEGRRNRRMHVTHTKASKKERLAECISLRCIECNGWPRANWMMSSVWVEAWYLLSLVACARGAQRIVLAVVDDLGWADAGFQVDMGLAEADPSRGWEATPRLDSLARSGVVFASLYGASECTPSRAMLMTGRHAVELGLQDSVIHSTEPRGLSPRFRTIADRLRALSYRTVCVGKWHLGFYAPRFLPRRRGFDAFFGILTGGGDHYAHTTTEAVACRGDATATATLTGRNLWEDDGPWRGNSTEHTTVLYGRRAVDELRRTDQNNNLFVYLAYQAVHGPVQADDQCGARHQDLCGMVKMIDDSLGRVAAELQRSQQDWLLWFVSDNGGVARHGSSNAPLRGEKGELWEGGVRLVSFVAGSQIHPRPPYHALTHLVDVHATILSAAGDDRLQEDSDFLCGRVVSFETPHREWLLVNRNSPTWGGGGALVYKNETTYAKIVVEHSVGDAVVYRAGRALLADHNLVAADLATALDERRSLLFASGPIVHLLDLDADLGETIPSDDAALKAKLLAKWASLEGLVRDDPTVWRDDGPLANPALLGGTWRPWRDDDDLPLATYRLLDDHDDKIV